MNPSGPPTPNPVVLCKSCGAECRWLVSAKGNFLLAELEGTTPNDTQFDFKRHTAHFARCPQAKAWRARAKRGDPL